MNKAIVLTKDLFDRLKNDRKEATYTPINEAPDSGGGILKTYDPRSDYERQLKSIWDSNLPPSVKLPLYKDCLTKLIDQKREEDEPSLLHVKDLAPSASTGGQVYSPGATAGAQGHASTFQGAGVQSPHQASVTPPSINVTADPVIGAIDQLLKPTYRSNAKIIYKYLINKNTGFRIDPSSGELISHGQRVSRSNIYDLLSNLSMRTGGSVKPKGFDHLGKIILDSYMPVHLVKNRARLRDLSAMKMSSPGPPGVGSFLRGISTASTPKPVHSLIQSQTLVPTTPQESSASYVSSAETPKTTTLDRLKQSWRKMY